MIRIPLLLLLAFLPFSGVSAIEVDVYSGEVTVADQSARERRQALPEALKHSLLKISGLRTLEAYPQVEAAVGAASSILVSFHYESRPRLLPDGSELTEQVLVARFAASEVDELVRQLQLPLWPSDRKPTEVWVVIDNGMTRQIMPLEFEYLRGTLDQVATHRGVPLSWPQPDEEGQYPVDLQLLWGGYTEDLASPRGDGILILAARREGLEWSVRSNLGFESENWAWRIRDIDLQAALDEALQLATDQMAASEAIAASDLGTWRHELTVVGLAGSADYEQCLSYLQDMALVERITVLAAQPGSVTFSLQLNALPLYFEDQVASGSLLEFDESKQQYRFTTGVRRDG